MKSFESVRPRFEAEMQNLVTRKLKRATENLMEEGEKKIKRSVGDFFSDAEDLLMRYLPEFDSRDFVKSIQNKIQMDMDSSDLFSYDSGSDENEYGLVDYLGDLLNVIELGLPNLVGNIFTHDEDVAKIESIIEDPKSFDIPSWMLNRREDYETGEDIHLIESDLDMTLRDDLNRMKKTRSYKGRRHEVGLPVRGQRTKSTFRKSATVGVRRS